MSADLGVLLGKLLDLLLGQVAAEAEVQLAGEVVVELGEELDVEEEDRSGGQLGGGGIEEDLGAVVLVLEVGTLLGLDGKQTHLDDVGSVAKKDSLTSYITISTRLPGFPSFTHPCPGEPH